MIPATDRILESGGRALGLGLVLMAVIGQSGCAKWKAFSQSSNQPVEFGTDFPVINDSRPGFSGPAVVGPQPNVFHDPYVERFGRPKAVPGDPPVDTILPGTGPSAAPGTAPLPAPPPSAIPAPPPEIEIIPKVSTRSSEHPQIGLTPPVNTAAAPDSKGSLTPAASSAAVPAPAIPLPDAPPAPTVPVPSADQTLLSPPSGGPTLASVIGESRAAVNGLSTYQVSMNHQERVNGILNPSEEVLLSVRTAPKAIRLEWPAGVHKGREVIFIADEGKKGLMHVHMGNSLVPMPDLTMPPDSPMALKSSRHPISEAGFETIVERLEGYQKSSDGAGSMMRLSYEGLEQPAGLAKACHKILRVSPEGEIWLVYLDPESHLPAMVQGTAPNGELIERHIFREVSLERPELAKADAFDPIARWGEPKGFLQKLARAASNNDSAKPQ